MISSDEIRHIGGGISICVPSSFSPTHIVVKGLAGLLVPRTAIWNPRIEYKEATSGVWFSSELVSKSPCFHEQSNPIQITLPRYYTITMLFRPVAILSATLCFYFASAMPVDVGFLLLLVYYTPNNACQMYERDIAEYIAALEAREMLLEARNGVSIYIFGTLNNSAMLKSFSPFLSRFRVTRML
jgi:hypothetical protein